MLYHDVLATRVLACVSESKFRSLAARKRMQLNVAQTLARPVLAMHRKQTAYALNDLK